MPTPPDARLLTLADQCVMCGLCLPHCPTYRLSRHEAESPRGRIALIRRIAAGEPPSSSALEHLDHCLSCLSCQKVCPSQVRYGELIDGARARLWAERVDRPHRFDPRRLTLLARLGTWTRAGRWLPALARLLPKGSRARRLAAEAPLTPPSLRTPAIVRKDIRGELTLFPGCVARELDHDTLAAARMLLETLGWRVTVPAGAVCCGALARHAGDAESARTVEAATRRTLSALPAATVLVSASGCLGPLRDQALLDTTLAVDDVAGFIARDERLATLRFRPLHQRAAWHLACTQGSVGDGGAAARALLARIPGLELVPLPEQPRCCGAAGAYFIEQPVLADRLRTEKLNQATALAPDLLLTGNVGCRVFLGNGLRQRDAALPVLHPLVLLARQLDTAAS
ncbi:heterodisulfide reductase-related iron-sulfur binding cluster [Dokdonella sp.]|uniref:(Fe-S)-binding protein n=1 Tax=Dokdonella sp. TaxID=2291710 RepID=UPI0025BB7813|nr:heterodisulfide reductase-related iron-sulfur binding cluster [Dokdonella sp.]MBX3691110.1 4Fe-4S dicluster domain-containing protein [Dokdonella sp.]